MFYYFALRENNVLCHSELEAFTIRYMVYGIADIDFYSIYVELRVVGEGGLVLSPRGVMLAMAHYIENFDLTSEQVLLCSLNDTTTWKML